MEVCFLNWFELNISSILGKFSPPVLVLTLLPPFFLSILSHTHTFTRTHKSSFFFTQSGELYRHQVLKSSFGISTKIPSSVYAGVRERSFDSFLGGWIFNAFCPFLFYRFAG